MNFMNKNNFCTKLTMKEAFIFIILIYSRLVIVMNKKKNTIEALKQHKSVFDNDKKKKSDFD